MKPIDILDDGPSRPPKRGMPLFDFTFNLGHVFIVLSFLLTGILFYADKQSHTAVVEQEVQVLTQANLPARLDRLEITTSDMHEWMDRETQLLTQIRDRLDTKADRTSPK